MKINPFYYLPSLNNGKTRANKTQQQEQIEKNIRDIITYPNAFCCVTENSKGKKIYKGCMRIQDRESRFKFKKYISELKKLGIKTIYGPSGFLEYGFMKPMIKRAGINLVDLDITDYKEIFDQMDKSDSNIYLACQTGSGRSAVMSAYYLVWKKGLSLKEAEQKLKDHTDIDRMKIHYNDEITKQVSQKTQDKRHAEIMYFHRLGRREPVKGTYPERSRLINNGAILDGD